MVVFPPCKINLGLHVLSRRPDGFHDIETCFYPVPWSDVLEILPSSQQKFVYTGIPIPGKAESNLCYRAVEMLRHEYHIPPVELQLHKTIPTGSGLGGGSSDAAAVLTTIDKIFSLGMTLGKLRSYATRLGSDCTFFLDPQPSLGAGKGEVLTETSLSLGGKFLVIIVPGVSVDTREAYQSVRPTQPREPLSEIVNRPPASWRNTLVNDFEETVFRTYPVLAAIKSKLYDAGATYASMSGSGSALFGLFDKVSSVAGTFGEMKTWSGMLLR